MGLMWLGTKWKHGDNLGDGMKIDLPLAFCGQ